MTERPSREKIYEIINYVKENCNIDIDDRVASEISKLYLTPGCGRRQLCVAARRVVKKRNNDIIKSVKERCGIDIDDREASEISKHVKLTSSNLCEVATRVVQKRIDGSACKVSDAKDVKYFRTEAEASAECAAVERKSGVKCVPKIDKKSGRYYVAVVPPKPKQFDAKCDRTELYDYFPLTGERGIPGRGELVGKGAKEHAKATKKKEGELFEEVTKRLFYSKTSYMRKQVVEDGQIVGVELIICVGE